MNRQDDARAYNAARDRLGGAPTQGKCPNCERFFYFSGPLHRRRCPIASCKGRALERTSGQSTLPRFVIEDRRGGPNVLAVFDLVATLA